MFKSLPHVDSLSISREEDEEHVGDIHVNEELKVSAIHASSHTSHRAFLDAGSFRQLKSLVKPIRED